VLQKQDQQKDGVANSCYYNHQHHYEVTDTYRKRWWPT